MTKKEAFATMMQMLGETFNRQLSSGMLDGYWMALEDLSIDEIKDAARKAAAECRFMPVPAELRALVRAPKNVAADVVQAWQAVRKAIDKHDYLVASIDFGPLVNAVIRNLGGWDTFCRARLPELDNPGWLRKRFEEVYRALSTAEPTTLHGEPLQGALPPKWQDKPNHVIVSLDGAPTRLRIEANGTSDARASIAELVGNLADGKALSE